MNDTNRVLNRLIIVAFGLVLLVAGAVAAAVALVPVVRNSWASAADDATRQVSTWLQQTPLGDTGVSWVMPAVLVLLVVAVILLVVFIMRQGRGHTGTVLAERTSERGSTVIDSAVAEHALQDALAERAEFVATRVSTYRVRRTPVLKVSVICRRGVSPKSAATVVEERLRALDELLGRELPALIQVSGGFRARVTRSTRLR